MITITIEAPEGSRLDSFTIENSGCQYILSRVDHGIQSWWMGSAHLRAGKCEILEAGIRPALPAMLAEVERHIDARRRSSRVNASGYDANGSPVEVTP